MSEILMAVAACIHLDVISDSWHLHDSRLTNHFFVIKTARIAMVTMQNQITRNFCMCSSQWRHNEYDGVSNHQPRDYLLNRLFRRSSKKTSKLRVTSLCTGYSPVTVEFPAQMASNAENVSIWWCHHELVTWQSRWTNHQLVNINGNFVN